MKKSDKKKKMEKERNLAISYNHLLIGDCQLAGDQEESSKPTGN